VKDISSFQNTTTVKSFLSLFSVKKETRYFF